MPSRAAFLLTPSDSIRPPSLPFYKHRASVSPLFATLRSRPKIIENALTLSPFLATHTDFSLVSPVFATHTKTTGVCTNNSHSGTRSLPSRLLAPKAMSGHNVTGPSPLRIKSDAPCMARRFSRGRTSPRFSSGDRDSPRLQREVRIGQSEWAIKGGSHHPFGGVLSSKLWIHPADLRRRQRSAGCAGFVPGAGTAIGAHPSACHWLDDHDRFRSERRQGHRRGHQRSGIQQLCRSERIAAASLAGSEAFFPGLQAVGRQAGASGRYSPSVCGGESDRTVAGALQGAKRNPSREGPPLIQMHYSYGLSAVLACSGGNGPSFWCACDARGLPF